MIDRRTLLRTAGSAAGATLVLGGGASAATAMPALPARSPSDVDGARSVMARPGVPGRFDRPFSGYAPAATTLRRGRPERVGLSAGPIDAAQRQVAGWTEPDPASGHPLFSGAVTMMVHNGVIVHHEVVGKSLRYADQQGTELPAGQQIAMRGDTIFDMASISKLFTSIVVLRLAEAGKLAIDAPVVEYLPEFGVHGKETITVQQLLTHTSGLQPDLPTLWQDYPDIPSRRKAVLEVEPQAEPGATYEYSDLNMLTLQFVAEQVSESTLEKLVREGITRPLGLSDTGYNPPKRKRRRIAATEYQQTPARGLVWGVVHDEKAWSLAGVGGHAGVFSTARDLAVLGQTILNGGTYAGKRILREASVEQMLTNYNEKFPDDSHGLGFELNQIWYMGALTSPRGAGHTGFTGTSMVIDPLSRSVAILLTNRVHPSREWGSINVAREATASGLAKAMAVAPSAGQNAWYTSGTSNASTTLTTPTLGGGRGETAIEFHAFVDTEPTDTLVLEASDNGGEWYRLAMRATGPGAPDGEVKSLSGNGHRAWWKVTATYSIFSPPPNFMRLRWRYRTDDSYRGRGVLVDGVLLDGGRTFDGEKEHGRFVADGWRSTDR